MAGLDGPMYHTFGAPVRTSPTSPLFRGPCVMHEPSHHEIPLAIRKFRDGTVILHGGADGRMHDESLGKTDKEAERVLASAVVIAPALADVEIEETRRARRPIP